jgi:dimethylamine monooxygenase subunit A
MRPLPPEILHDPIEPGPYRMAMGLTVIPDRAWFELDTQYQADMAEKQRLLAERQTDVFAAPAGTEAAATESLQLIAANLCDSHPDWFASDGDLIHNRLTNVVLDPRVDHPLLCAGRLVQEDLCLIQDGAFTAGILCFPSRWRLAEKIGRPLAAVHAPVPLYPDRLAQPVDRFMRHLRPGRIACRLNWSILDDPALFQPEGKWRSDPNHGVTVENAGETLFLRVERQTLRRLPETNAVLFGIRVHVYPLWRVASSRLAAAVRALPDDILRYKSMSPILPALLGYLDARAATETTKDD